MEPRVTAKYDAVKHYLDLEPPKSEIGDELDLKADEAFADDASMSMAKGLRELLSVYGSGMSLIEENLKSFMKLEGFAEKVIKNDASN